MKSCSYYVVIFVVLDQVYAGKGVTTRKVPTSRFFHCAYVFYTLVTRLIALFASGDWITSYFPNTLDNDDRAVSYFSYESMYTECLYLLSCIPSSRVEI